jgi:hypothetical protein
MTTSPGRLPPADPLLVAQTSAALPARLRAKLDATVAAAATWVLDGLLVRLPGGAEVTLSPSPDGVLRHPDQVVCGCLLAPGCLHRAGVLVAAPIAEPDPPADPQPELAADLAAESASVPAAGSASVLAAGSPAQPWTPAERQVAELIGTAAARLLESGVAGAGAAAQAELLTGVHRARLAGLHRLAAATTRVVTGVRAARQDDAAFSLPALTSDLLEVLEVVHAVRTGLVDSVGLRGQARTGYAAVGGLRLTGLCLEPVLADSGYAGVVVWLIDADGRIWSVSDVKPGGEERITAAAQAAVALGEAGLSHRRLSRGGLILSGATANADGRLGAGAKVRAVSSAPAAWTSPELLERFAGLDSGAAGGSLMLLDLTVCGSQDGVLLAVDSAGVGVRLVSSAPGGSAWADTARRNVQILGAAAGSRLLVIARAAAGDASERVSGGRLAAEAPGTVELLAVGGGDLRLPEQFGGHADLGIDRLSPAFLTPSGPAPLFPQAPAEPDPLLAVRRRLRRVVSGGRRTLSVPGVPETVRSEASALRRAQLPTTAARLEALLAAGQPAQRDVFGRLIDSDPVALSQAWLIAGIQVRAVTAAIRAGSSARSHVL